MKSLFFILWKCHFGKHKSNFLQILHQFLLPPNITLLNFFSSNITNFVQKELIKVQIFRCPSTRVKTLQILVSKSASFFTVTIHNFSVNFKLIHFLFWIKESHQIPTLRLLSALVKIYQICQISHVFFQTTSQFFFQI